MKCGTGTRQQINSLLCLQKLTDAEAAAAAARHAKQGAASWWLQDVSMRLLPGQLVAVVGRVGAGKSSLLAALLGEMERSRCVLRPISVKIRFFWKSTLKQCCNVLEKLQTPLKYYKLQPHIQAFFLAYSRGRIALGGRMAYVAQQAWILNDTLENNVLFGQPWDEARWNAVVEVPPFLDGLAEN